MSLRAVGNNLHNVKLYHETSAAESMWGFYKKPNKGGYLIVNEKEKSLALGEATDDSTIASPITERPTQIGGLKEAGGGFYFFENQYDGKVMGVKGSNTVDNTDIINYTYTGATNQKFRLVHIKDFADGPKST